MAPVGLLSFHCDAFPPTFVIVALSVASSQRVAFWIWSGDEMPPPKFGTPTPGSAGPGIIAFDSEGTGTSRVRFTSGR
jgi:hypothetical protein